MSSDNLRDLVMTLFDLEPARTPHLSYLSDLAFFVESASNERIDKRNHGYLHR